MTWLNPLKLDDKATLGLAGTYNSLAYRVHEIEKHFHNSEDWFGVAASPSATNKADDVTTGTLAAFQIDAGEDAWGAWVQILGSADTPNRDGMAKFDLHKIQFVDAETAAVKFFVQISVGATGDAGITALNYTTIAYTSAASKATEAAVNFMMKRADAGSLVWARCMAIGTDTCTLDFYFGLHEYVG